MKSISFFSVSFCHLVIKHNPIALKKKKKKSPDISDSS